MPRGNTKTSRRMVQGIAPKLIFSKGAETVISKAVNKKRTRHRFKLRIRHLLGFVTFCIYCGISRGQSRRLKIRCGN